MEAKKRETNTFKSPWEKHLQIETLSPTKPSSGRVFIFHREALNALHQNEEVNQEKGKQQIQKTRAQPREEVREKPRKTANRIVNTFEHEKRSSGLWETWGTHSQSCANK